MQLDGSCYCGEVKFTCVSRTPYPYMRCYCSICRKTAGGGGYAINIMALYDSLKIEGEEHINSFHPKQEHPDNPDKLVESRGKRYFCKHCGTALWAYDERWAEWIYLHASCIDTALPKVPETTHIMLEFKATWCETEIGENDKQFSRYPEESIADWHQRLKLTEE
ncbi:MAG: GFA family protein [Acidiferrobacterales bacterium]